MPKGYYTIEGTSVKTDQPLDSIDPKIEPLQAEDKYLKLWGSFRFIYESEETLALGGLSAFAPFVEGITLSPPDVWNVPNMELGGGGAGGPVQQDPPTSDEIADALCTEANVADPTVAALCMTIVRDGCDALNRVLPSAAQVSGRTFSFTFSNGFSMTWRVESTFCGRSDVGQVIATVFCSTCTATYTAAFFNTPRSCPPAGGCGHMPCGASDVLVFESHAKAADIVIDAVKTAVGNCCPGLGALCA